MMFNKLHDYNSYKVKIVSFASNFPPKIKIFFIDELVSVCVCENCAK